MRVAVCGSTLLCHIGLHSNPSPSTWSKLMNDSRESASHQSEKPVPTWSVTISSRSVFSRFIFAYQQLTLACQMLMYGHAQIEIDSDAVVTPNPARPATDPAGKHKR